MSAAAQSSGYDPPKFSAQGPGYIRPRYGVPFVGNSSYLTVDLARRACRVPTSAKDVPFMWFNIHSKPPKGITGSNDVGVIGEMSKPGEDDAAAVFRQDEPVMTYGGEPGSTVGNAVATTLLSSLGRYQHWPGAGTSLDWPSVADSADQYWYHYTFFPCIRRFAQEIRGITYVAFYSNFDPWELGGGQRCIPYSAPQWKEYKTQKDKKTGVEGSTVMIDDQFVGNDDTILAIKSALENTRPFASTIGKRTYLCFFPLVDAETYEAESPYVETETFRSWRLTGASLGWAIGACIKGDPSVFYTGYLSAIYPNEKIMRSGEEAGDRYDIPVQINFVEQVNDVVLKVAYCSASPPLPLIIPNKDNLNRYIPPDKLVNSLKALSAMAPRFYTNADLDDGRAFMFGNTFSTPVCMVATTTESSVLASYLWVYAQYFQAAFVRDTANSVTDLIGAQTDYTRERNEALALRVMNTRQENEKWKKLFADETTRAQAEKDYKAQLDRNYRMNVFEPRAAKIADSERARVDSLRRSQSANAKKVANQVGRKLAKATGKKFVTEKKAKKESVATKALRKAGGTTLQAKSRVTGVARPTRTPTAGYSERYLGAGGAPKGARAVYQMPPITEEELNWEAERRRRLDIINPAGTRGRGSGRSGMSTGRGVGLGGAGRGGFAPSPLADDQQQPAASEDAQFG